MSKFVEALQFYADAWKSKSNKLYGGLEWSPTEALLDDCGNRAKEAIAALSAKPTEPTMVTDAQFVAGMREALKDCADDLEAEIEERYRNCKEHPSMRVKYARDIEPVKAARAILAEADAIAREAAQ